MSSEYLLVQSIDEVLRIYLSQNGEIPGTEKPLNVVALIGSELIVRFLLQPLQGIPIVLHCGKNYRIGQVLIWVLVF